VIFELLQIAGMSGFTIHFFANQITNVLTAGSEASGFDLLSTKDLRALGSEMFMVLMWKIVFQVGKNWQE
jgi:hypothetical protein